MNKSISIPLMHKNKIVYVLVDEEDFPKIARYRWYIMHGYARAEWRGTTISLARLIMKFPQKEVDHINRNRLDNRKSNLRLATRQQNNINAVKASSGYRGVAQRSQHSYRAFISVGYTRIYSGGHKTAEEAAQAYNKLARKHHGAFAILNTVPPSKETT